MGGALADLYSRLLLGRCRAFRVRERGARGKGVGRALLEALLRSADEGGIWTIQTNVFPENDASLALHERVGFRVVGRRERIAQLDDVWRDTLLPERRV